MLIIALALQPLVPWFPTICTYFMHNYHVMQALRQTCYLASIEIQLGIQSGKNWETCEALRVISQNMFHKSGLPYTKMGFWGILQNTTPRGLS
ncbi:hypothetical protein BDD12DRAFT_821058 [Trichophaea hybrida]|nr:hypothetical protein BDD12DRAFT_821058 [Trichophaea hybrida]